MLYRMLDLNPDKRPMAKAIVDIMEVATPMGD